VKSIVASVLILAWFAASVAAHAAAGVQAAASDEVYTRPGALVSAGATKLSFYCMGTGSPTVVFDSGFEDWSPAWSLIQPVISRHTRACAYDRAGYGFSDPGPMPRTSVQIAKELHTALHDAGIPGPYVLVAHSFGGYNMRTFADLYMPEVYGAVFVDVESGDLESAKARATDARFLVSGLRELKQCRQAIANHQPLPPLPPDFDPPTPDTPCPRQLYRGLPMPEWSSALNTAVLHIAETRVALWDALISEEGEMPADARWLTAHRRSFGSRPIRVITAQDHYRDDDLTPPPVHRKHFAFERDWVRAQHKLVSLSSNSKQILVRKSTHYVQFDQPQAVVDAILSELPKP
jgi:pimeloyl-ACP methyl ester carboxylesterase